MRFKTFLCICILSTATIANADEGGVGFWVPGFFGSLAAAPIPSGFSLTNIYYYTNVEAGPEVAFARQVAPGRVKAKFSGDANIALKAKANVLFEVPSYTFFHSILNGQGTIALGIPYGRSRANVNTTVTGSFGIGPGFTLGRARSDRATGFGDLALLFNLRWNAGVHNFLIFTAKNLTLGVYDSSNLTNLGINHSIIDGGAGYTYFDATKGYEFSSVLGFTYNFPNGATQYQNGKDLHLDLSASKFFNKKTQIGVVGYAYKQLSCDKGEGVFVGCFKARIFGAGPQIGYIVSRSSYQVYFNLKGYKEFAALHRAEGWNAWLTLVISPASHHD